MLLPLLPLLPGESGSAVAWSTVAAGAAPASPPLVPATAAVAAARLAAVTPRSATLGAGEYQLPMVVSGGTPPNTLTASAKIKLFGDGGFTYVLVFKR